MNLSKKGIDLILQFEVGGGESYYNKFLIHPEYPGAESGITIGIGWDCRFNTKDQFSYDWNHHLSSNDFNSLSKVIGLKGSTDLVNGLKTISIPWKDALQVFEESTIPRFYNLMIKTFPGANKLDIDCQGGLTSLLFNRGSSLTGDSRKEMRNIRDLIPKKKYKEIAQNVRDMKRLWAGKNLPGLLRRRDAEANLIESSS